MGQLGPLLTATVALPAPPTRRRRDVLREPLLGAAATAAATVIVALRDPHIPGSYGYCPLYALTGLYCPACGALRATHDLAHLDLAGAWAANPLWVLVAPVVVVGWVVLVVRRWRGAPTRELPVWTGWAALGVVAAFGVLRNLPAFAWLAP